ncbi:MAG: phosphoribosylanthranilate isomerase [Anaerolineae bacterium]
MTLIKFCGLTRSEDVRTAVQLGVNFLGLNFVLTSPRFVELSRATHLCQVAREEAVHRGIPVPKLVGVFAGEDAGTMTSMAARCGLDCVQVYGAVSTGSCEWQSELDSGLGLAVIRAWQLRPGEPLPEIGGESVWAHLVDAFDPQRLGGSGQVCDWSVAAALARQCRLFLAGGLRPENVAEAIRAVAPFAVDVASGIETRPGIKDVELMRRFVEEVRGSS